MTEERAGIASGNRPPTLLEQAQKLREEALKQIRDETKEVEMREASLEDGKRKQREAVKAGEMLGATRAALASAAGVSENAISSWIGNKRPKKEPEK